MRVEAERPRDEKGQFAKDEPAEAQAEDQTVTINHKGKSITVPMDRVVALASKGFDYEQKMGAVKEERAQVQADSSGFQAYQDYKSYMVSNPGIAQLVGQVLEDYETTGVIPQVVADQMISEEGGTVPNPPGNSKLEREMAELRAQWDNAQAQGQQQEHTRRLVQAVERNPVLARVSDETFRKYGRDLALEKLAAMAQLDPSNGALPSPEDMETYADAVATEFTMASETLGGGSGLEERKAQDAARFKSEPPSGSPPPAPTPTAPSFSAKDLKSGALAKGAADFLASRLT